MQEFFLVVKPVSFCWDVFWMYWYIIWCICPFCGKKLLRWLKLQVFRKDFSRKRLNTRWWFQFFFIFIPIPGKMIQLDEHIFQMGWFNHQLEKLDDFLKRSNY